jgi:hypothetical protein
MSEPYDNEIYLLLKHSDKTKLKSALAAYNDGSLLAYFVPEPDYGNPSDSAPETWRSKNWGRGTDSDIDNTGGEVVLDESAHSLTLHFWTNGEEPPFAAFDAAVRIHGFELCAYYHNPWLEVCGKFIPDQVNDDYYYENEDEEVPAEFGPLFDFVPCAAYWAKRNADKKAAKLTTSYAGGILPWEIQPADKADSAVFPRAPEQGDATTAVFPESRTNTGHTTCKRKNTKRLPDKTEILLHVKHRQPSKLIEVLAAYQKGALLTYLVPEPNYDEPQVSPAGWRLLNWDAPGCDIDNTGYKAVFDEFVHCLKLHFDIFGESPPFKAFNAAAERHGFDVCAYYHNPWNGTFGKYIPRSANEEYDLRAGDKLSKELEDLFYGELDVEQVFRHLKEIGSANHSLTE